ncbi:MAG: hypothetical protein F4X50_09295 [Synechococcus sp. SB0662_bin_14]|nr:hypothetical protein [Synechococcus sp. SB0662_bin_14]
MAAQIILGRSATGPQEWKDENDTSLKFLRESDNLEVRNERENVFKRLKEKYEDQINNPSKRTEVERLGKQRIGQNILRDLLLQSEECCPFTGIKCKELLHASHIKPWKDCNDDERLDPDNCILLSSLWDAAFDKGLVTFDSEGKPKISVYLCKEAKDIMMGNENNPINDRSIPITDKRERFLEWHRGKIFRESNNWDLCT